MAVNLENLDDEKYEDILLSTVDEVCTGPFVYCGVNDSSEEKGPIFVYRTDWTDAAFLLNQHLSKLLPPEYPMHNLQAGWVKYIQTFFKRMDCIDACFIMMSEEGHIYHAFNGLRRNIAHAVVDTLEYLYSANDDRP